MSLKYYKVEIWVLKEAIKNLDLAIKALENKGQTSTLIERSKKISELIKDNYPAITEYKDDDLQG